MNFRQDKKTSSQLLQTTLIVVGVAALLALFIYAYLGTFTRYMADDYCHTELLSRGNILDVSIQKYMRTSNRYSTMLFFGFSELFGEKGVAVLPPLMIFLWLFGLIWTLSQLKKISHVDLSSTVIFAISALLSFFTFLQAPNLYQSVYWRAASVTYFAPLVFITWLGGFIVLRIRRAQNSSMPLWALLFTFLAAFLIGGLSETIGALHIAALGLSFIGIWLWGKKGQRKSALILISSTLAGAFLSLLTMFLAPANALRQEQGVPELAVLLRRFIQFPFDFILDTFKILPIPSLVSIGILFLIFYGLYVDRSSKTKEEKTRLLLATVFSPLLMYVLIAASFAPSVYGQSYPVERVRFPAHWVMTSILMLEGALWGILAAQIRLKVSPKHLRLMASIFLGISALYPLRATWQAYQTLPKYQTRAAAWDARNAEIWAKKEEGARDIVVGALPGIERVKELDVDATHWVNRCAARYYGVDTIRALP